MVKVQDQAGRTARVLALHGVLVAEGAASQARAGCTESKNCGRVADLTLYVVQLCRILARSCRRGPGLVGAGTD